MSNRRKPRGQRTTSIVCAGCGGPTKYVDREDGRYWYREHRSDCPYVTKEMQEAAQ